MFIESELNLKDEKVIDSLIKTSHKTTPKKPKIAPKRKRLEAEKKQTSEKICLSSSSGNISKILPRGHTKIKKQRTAVSKKLVTSPREHIQAELKFTQETIDYLVQPEIKQQIKAAIKCDWDTLPAKDKRKIFTLKLIKRPDINAFITAHFFNNGEITLNNTTVKIILLKLYESYETLHKIAHSLIKEDGEANLFLGPKLLNSNMCIGEAIGRKLNKRFKVKATTKVTHPEKTESPKNFSPRAEGVVSMHYELDSVKTKLSFLMPAQPLRSACFPAGCAASIVESLLTPYLNGASGSGNSIMSDSDIEEDTCSETSNITASEGDDEASIASNSSACS